MKLNHLNLTVSDASESRRFLEKYFGLQGDVNPYTGQPTGAKDNRNFAILFDDDGLVLTLIRDPKAEIRYPSSFHIGFIQPSEQAVNDINERLRTDGYDVPLPSHQHGSWTFYFEAPGGFTIEVLC